MHTKNKAHDQKNLLKNQDDDNDHGFDDDQAL